MSDSIMKQDRASHPIQKNQSIELDVTEMNNLGSGVGHAEDGRVVFVRGALTGERVRATVIKVTASYLVARLDRVLSPSPHRLPPDAPDCGAAESCGGCIYRHITYEHELALKQSYVKNAFCKVGLSDVEVEPVHTTERVYGYRNKAQYPVGQAGGRTVAGFYATKSHTVLPCDGCLLQPPVFSRIVSAVCAFCDEHRISVYDETSGRGLLRHIYLREGAKSGEIMVCLVINGNEFPHARALCDKLCAECPSISSIMLSHNKKNTNVVLGDRYTTLYGTPYIQDTLCDLTFRIAPDAFYQVNHDGAELLYRLAADKAALTGDETLLDLYCGIGTIGMSMAKQIKHLIGVEIVPAAVECAKYNAQKNGLDNADFFCADASDPDTLLSCLGNTVPDLVVLDPPRKGSTNALIDAIGARDIRRVIYISCDPDTLARDCVRFRQNGYDIGTVTPMDMFPRTGHVESVVCLSRKTTHEMKLYASPFEKIKSGAKNIELRLFDEKRQKIKMGDDIIFTNTINGEKMRATVKALHRFDSFEELYKTLPLLQCGYTAEDVDAAHPSDMEQYYSAEEQKQYGVIGIELFPPKRITGECVALLCRDN